MHTVDTNSRQIQRYAYEGKVWVSLEDMLYLCEADRDRHAIQGHDWAASAMSNFAGSLQMMLMI